MRKAIINNVSGLVVNVIVLEDDAEFPLSSAFSLIDAGDAGPGDIWDGAKFVKPAIDQGEIIEAIKAEAAERILAIAKEWQQRNAMARGLEFLEIMFSGVALTPEEDAELRAIKAMRAAIKAIRDASNDLEAAASAMTSDELAALDPADSVHWP